VARRKPAARVRVVRGRGARPRRTPGRLTAVGIGASGLVRSLVVYGEVWTLTAPAETRYAAGVSGSIPDGLWTIEASYGQEGAGLLARLRLGETLPRQQLAAQLTRRLGEDLTVTGTARVFSTAEPYRAHAALELTRTAGDATYSLAVITLAGHGPMVPVIAASVRVAF
jgi:hypothetical protein